MITEKLLFYKYQIIGCCHDNDQPKFELLSSPLISELEFQLHLDNRDQFLTTIKSTTFGKLNIILHDYGFVEFSIPKFSLPMKTIKELLIRMPYPGYRILFKPENIFEIGSIPTSVTKLGIPYSFFRDNHLIIPDSVTELIILEWDLSIVEPNSLPSYPSITTLEIDAGVFKLKGPNDDRIHSRLFSGDLPNTIKKLEIEPRFHFEMGSIPNSVEFIKFPIKLDQILEPGIVPFGCKTVKFGHKFKQLLVGSIPENSGPKFSELFPLLEYFDCPFSNIRNAFSIPNSVLELKIDNEDQHLKEGVIPSNLKSLIWSNPPKIEDSFSNFTIPNSLQHLTISSLKNDDCKDVFNQISKIIFLTDKNKESQLTSINLVWDDITLINLDKNDPYLYFKLKGYNGRYKDGFLLKVDENFKEIESYTNNGYTLDISYSQSFPKGLSQLIPGETQLMVVNQEKTQSVKVIELPPGEYESIVEREDKPSQPQQRDYQQPQPYGGEYKGHDNQPQQGPSPHGERIDSFPYNRRDDGPHPPFTSHGDHPTDYNRNRDDRSGPHHNYPPQQQQ
eukprot:gene7615-9366_t